MENYLVTGASGFLGANVVLEILDRGDHVDACDFIGPVDDLAADAHRAPGTVEWIRLDVRSRGDWRDLPDRDYRAVIHAAAVTPGRDESDPLRTADINLMGALRGMEWAAERCVRRFVFVSSSAVYRGGHFSEPMTEEAEVSPPFSYGILKRAAEVLQATYREHRGLDGCSVRLPSLYGPWERPTGSRQNMSLPYHLARAAVAGHALHVSDVRNSRDWLYVRDAARALLHAATLDGGPDLFNLSTGHLTDLHQMLAALDEMVPEHRVCLVADPGEADLVLPEIQEEQPMNPGLLADSGFNADTTFEGGMGAYLSWLGSHPREARSE